MTTKVGALVRKRPRHKLKVIEAMFRAAEEQGARVEGGGRCHFRVYPPNGSAAFSVHTTGYDGSLTKGVRSRFRQGGLEV